jgi:hypothetical protein
VRLLSWSHETCHISIFPPPLFLSLLSGKYCDIPLGLYIVRGDNIVLLGQIDDELEASEMRLEKISPEELANYPDDGNEKVIWDFE